MNYLLREIDPTLWRHAKLRAETEGRTVRQVLLAAVAQYAAGLDEALDARLFEEAMAAPGESRPAAEVFADLDARDRPRARTRRKSA